MYTRRDRFLELLRLATAWDRVLMSGEQGQPYIDSLRVVAGPEGAYLAGWLLYRLIRGKASGVDAVGGLELGAAPLATAVSLASFYDGGALCSFHVRKEAKAHERIAGLRRLPKGARVAIIDDVIRTGAAVMKAANCARIAGLEVVLVAGIVDLGGRPRSTIAGGVPLHTLFSASDFASSNS